jgi:methylmalonyl-CoA mutase N-terminal domain/subunit
MRTQQIIAHESGVADIIDPLGGSYALEALTDDLEAKALAYLSKIDAMGGMVEAIARGYPQREIEDAAFQYQREIEEKTRIIVGVNEFASTGEVPIEVMKVDPRLEDQQAARVKAFRKERDSRAAERALDDLKRAAKGEDNLMVPIVAAVKARATLGEIADAMRTVFGEHGRARAS